MKATLVYDGGMRFIGENEKGNHAYFDASAMHGGEGTAPSPMETLLQSVAACSAMDVIGILRKKQRTVKNLVIEMEAERASEHPRVFTTMQFTYILYSPDATEADLRRSVELSQNTYCSASAMVKRSGCTMNWECRIIPD